MAPEGDQEGKGPREASPATPTSPYVLQGVDGEHQGRDGTDGLH